MRPGGFVHAAEFSCFDGVNDVDSDHGRRSMGGRPAGEGTACPRSGGLFVERLLRGRQCRRRPGLHRPERDDGGAFLPIRTFDSSGRDTSFTGGGQLGCNWQFDPSWVVGLEGDINYLHGSRGQSFRIPGEDTVQQTRLRWLATVRARFGYAWGPSYLYATGGLALGDVKSSVTVAADFKTPLMLLIQVLRRRPVPDGPSVRASNTRSPIDCL